MGSIFDEDVLIQMEQNAKKSTKFVEDTNYIQLPDDITDEEIVQLINKLK